MIWARVQPGENDDSFVSCTADKEVSEADSTGH